MNKFLPIFGMFCGAFGFTSSEALLIRAAIDDNPWFILYLLLAVANIFIIIINIFDLIDIKLKEDKK